MHSSKLGQYSFKSVTTLVLLALWVASVAFVVFSSRGGANAIEIQSGDYALHMIAVEGYHHTATSAQEPLPDVAEMNTYPRWSHATVGYSSAVLGISPLQSIQIWDLILIVSGCLILALRVVQSADERPSYIGIVVCVLFLLASSYAGFGFSGHVEGNFFFPQLFGTVLAMGCLLLLQRVNLDVLIAGGVIFLVGGLCLPNIHLLPAIWFTLAALIHLVLTGNNWKKAIATCCVVGLACLYIWFGGSGSSMLKMANNNGAFLTSFGDLKAYGDHPANVITHVVFVVAIVIYFKYAKSTWQTARSRLIPYSGLIAVSILVIAQAALYFLRDQGSVYAIMKYSYIFSCEIAVLLISTAKTTAVSSSRVPKTIGPEIVLLLIVCALFLAQRPFISTPYDQTTLIKVREKLVELRGTLDPNNRKYPQFSSFEYPVNFYLALAVMRIPEDKRTVDWIRRGAMGEEQFTWPADKGMDPLLGEDLKKMPAPSAHYAYTVQLRTTLPLEESMPSAVKVPRHSVVNVEIVMPYLEDFSLAKQLPGKKGEVTFGLHAFDASGKSIFEGRNTLERVQTDKGIVLQTKIMLDDLPPSAIRLDFSPVQEWITWFCWKEKPNLTQIYLD